MFRGRPKRFLLKLEASPDAGHKGKDNGKLLEVESEMIVDIGCETPRINENFNGKPYNYFYAISSDVDRDNPGTVR
jgi:carotenoid isomerooxygenase